MKTEPNAEQLAAVRAFDNKYGRYWKRELRLAWETGNYDGEPYASLLQQIRNNFGPQWLIKFKL